MGADFGERVSHDSASVKGLDVFSRCKLALCRLSCAVRSFRLFTLPFNSATCSLRSRSWMLDLTLFNECEPEVVE